MILDAATGAHVSILSGHTRHVRSLAFSLGGALLVSGSDDCTIRFWDIQTGGVIRTFYGHYGSILSVSISLDCTTIASGSRDNTIWLWDVGTVECHHIIEEHTSHFKSIGFRKN